MKKVESSNGESWKEKETNRFAEAESAKAKTRQIQVHAANGILGS
jgi:hypothetical protein